MTTHSDMDEFVTDWNKCKGISNCEERRERERRHPDGRAFDRTSGKLERLATGSAVKNGRPHPVSRIESHLLPVIGQPLIEYSSAENSSFSNFYYSTLVLNYRDVEKFTPSFFFFFLYSFHSQMMKISDYFNSNYISTISLVSRGNMCGIVLSESFENFNLSERIEKQTTKTSFGYRRSTGCYLSAHIIPPTFVSPFSLQLDVPSI